MSDTRIYDLLAEWEERRQQGQTVSAEQLCPDDPVIQGEIRRRIERQQRLRARIEPVDQPDSGVGIPEVEGYDILDVIGSGGMGIVYRARHRRLDRIVALKMILAGGGADRQQLGRFRDEARAVAALQHPNIVQVHETGEAGGRPFLVLEFVPGGSLARHANGAPIAPRRAAELVAALARAVQHAHDRGIIHRDLKPANVLITDDGTPKVTDFGLAKRLNDNSGHTRIGGVIGSPSYMPPEQASGNAKAIGPATDVYALGAILYELLTGRPPFVGETMLETIRLVSEHPPVEPRAIQPSVPKDLQTVCLKCLEKGPEDRYESAAALAADLGNFLAAEPIRARPPSIMGIVARNLNRGNFDPSFESYGRVLLLLAPLPLFVHFAAYFGLRDHAQFPVLMTAISLLVVVLLQVPLHLYMFRSPALRLAPPDQRRHFFTVWSAEVVGDVVIWFLVWVALPADHPELMFLVYPLWAHQLANTYLAFASDAGNLYVQGGVFILLSLALVFVLPWTPLIMGGLMFLNMTVSGLLVRRGWGTRVVPFPPPGSVSE